VKQLIESLKELLESIIEENDSNIREDCILECAGLLDSIQDEYYRSRDSQETMSSIGSAYSTSIYEMEG